MTAKLAVVPNHPNRGQRANKVAANPTPAEILRAREDAGLTQQQAAALVHTSWHSWAKWEASASDENNRRMHPATWELFQVKLRIRKLLEQGKLAAEDVKRIGVHLPDPE